MSAVHIRMARLVASVASMLGLIVTSCRRKIAGAPSQAKPSQQTKHKIEAEILFDCFHLT